MNTKLHFSSANKGESHRDKWETPREIFHQLDAEFNFTLDAAAEESTALCEKFFSEKSDALKQDWGGETVYCNPPYSKLKAFSEKAKMEADKGATVVMLVPARTDTKAFHENLAGGEVRFIKGRLKFMQNGKSQAPAPFPSMVCVLGPNTKPNMKTVTKDNL
ncbi:phage N-6-adenine-methyltransferase [Pseudoalteromonas sp. L1]|uniref:phage N-6-adenine-methyltransferase n=1 Tax=Pseudoalteromonas sp. L1 TaxID=195716 RepID=UPI001EFF79FE|nr:phage N-6-adenine-methyltransferase [Pseudoalteromonas sp. L1]